jgi:DNA-directed RNA polymerase II subunit RPB11
MNQPDRYSRFVLPEGANKVEYLVDTKIKNAATYTIRLEDHTVGNLLRMQLHSDEAVVFAGYRIPHPLDPLMVVRIQTTESKAPREAMAHAILDLKAEVSELKQQLSMQVPRPPNPHMQNTGRQDMAWGDMGYGGPAANGYGGAAGVYQGTGGYQAAGGYEGY